jgi:hypothetical protein
MTILAEGSHDDDIEELWRKSGESLTGKEYWWK